MSLMFDTYTNGSKDLKLSIVEGSFNAVMTGAAMSFIVAYAVFLGANSVEIGLLSALPVLLGAWAQLFSIKMLDIYKSRKKIIIAAVGIQALSWIPILLIPFFTTQHTVLWVILFYTIGTVIAAIATPLWQSLMKSIVPPTILGKYFGARNAITGTVAFIVMILAGTLLNLFTPNDLPIFALIFFVSFLGRSCSMLLFTKIKDPIEDPKDSHLTDEKVTFREFTKSLLKTNFGHFVLFGSIMTFGISLTGPFLSFYWLEYIGLKNNYFMYTLLLASYAIASLIAMPYWGKLIDRYGKKKVLKATSYLAIIFPVLIILFRTPESILVTEFIDGILFSGFNLVLASYIYDVSSHSRIIRFASYQAVFFGTAAFLGAMLSGYLQTFTFSFFILSTSFYGVCALSILVRLFAYSAFIDKINEVNQVEFIKSKKIVLSVLTLAPVREMVFNNMISFASVEGGKIVDSVSGAVHKIEEEGLLEIHKVEKVIAKDEQRVLTAAQALEKKGVEKLSTIKRFTKKQAMIKKR